MKVPPRLGFAILRILQDPRTKQALKSRKLWAAVIVAALGAFLTQLGVDVVLIEELAPLLKALVEGVAPTQP